MRSSELGKTWIAAGALLLALAAAPVRAQSNACGAADDEDCNAAEYCMYDPGTCGEPGARGVCELRPEICTQDDQPVCGCDGLTYPNACVAAQSGIAVKANEPCAN